MMRGNKWSSLASACLLGLWLFTQSNSAYAKPVLILKNLRAEVDIIPENRSDFFVSIDKNGSDDPSPLVTSVRDKLLVESTLNTEVRSYRISLNLAPRLDTRLLKEFSNKPKVRPDNLTHIVIHAPMDLKIESNGNIFGRIRPISSLVIVDNGDGEWTIDTVDKRIEINGNGKTNFHLSNASTAIIDIMGTGNIIAKDIQSLFVSIYGSGSVAVGKVQSNTEVTIGGIGDFTAQSSSVTMRVDMDDAGHVNVLDGNLTKLTVRSLDGLGSVDFGGTVKDADINIGTKTTVHIHRLSGAGKTVLRQDARFQVDNR